MKPTAALLCITITLMGGADAARASRQNTPAPVARAAVSAGVASASSVAGRATVSRNNKNTPTTTSAGPSRTVAARAASTQKVINTGTQVATAAKNTALDSSCQQKYDGCMDAFCVMDNTSGGRCICSNKIKELDAQLSQIEKQDAQSYKIATVGVESVENNINTNNLISGESSVATDIKKTSATGDLRGAALERSAHATCIERMPECASELEMLQILYSGKIRSDCAAYENSLKQMQQSSTQKRHDAERVLRSATLDQLRNANKYDLGQCTVEFRKCMQTTAGCGDDFAACASVAANDETNTRKSTRVQSRKKNYTIRGTATSIEISASTYDILAAKRPMCDSITNQCQSVAASVWDTFLRESATQLRNAEIIAEDKIRQNCVASISDCFRTACKDNIDPNDPDGSYDMCLTRPGTMLNLCTVPLNACGVDASSQKNAEKSKIWEYVVARLAAMRVDACTNELKQCLQSDDRCGADYTGCVGLDTDTIIRMCPYDKLVGCQKVYGAENVRGDDVYDALSSMVQGIMLNIDNEMLAYCQNAANAAMIKVCGDTDNCNAMTTDENIGARSLEYKICEIAIDDNAVYVAYDKCRTDISQITDQELGRIPGATVGELGPMTPLSGIIDGIIYWDAIDVDEEGHTTGFADYFQTIGTEYAAPSHHVWLIKSELDNLHENVDRIVSAIESDPTVQYCMAGRTVPGMDNTKFGRQTARFPKLTSQMRHIIALHTLKTAQANYNKKYTALNAQMSRDYITMAERQAEIRNENAKDARREQARQSCIALADLSAIPKSPPPPPGPGGKIVVGIILVAAIVVVSVFTFGAGGIATAAGAAAAAEAGSAAAAATTATSISAATTLSTASSFAGAVSASAVAAGTPAVFATAAASAVLAPAASVAAATTTAAISTAAATIGSAASAAAAASLATSATIAAVAGSVGAAALATGIAQHVVKQSDGGTNSIPTQLTGHHETDQWNYRETIDTEFDWNKLNCHKCVTTKNCAQPKSPLFGKKYCKKWADSETTCTDIQF